MKKHILFLLLAVSFFAKANATAVSVTDSVFKRASYTHNYLDELATPIKPSYLHGAVVPSWADNWFVTLSGGASAFLGSPLGCEDLWGRIKPSVSFSVGKWHTPVVGNRLSFQGFEWKSGELTTQRYRHYHADLLVNLTPALGIGGADSRFDLIPFVGLGLIDNRTERRHPFAFNYGLQSRYRVSNRLHILAELSNAMTFADADGIGNAQYLGDNLFTFSAGISWTFGKHVGWKKVVDAQPYIARNEKHAAYMHDRYSNRTSGNVNEQKLYEGLHERHFPVNDYSGLNSLRRRLRESGYNNIETAKRASSLSDSLATNGSHISIGEASGQNVGNGLTQFHEGYTGIGAPIFFFFELGTTDLVNCSQLVNLHEIARIAIKNNFRVEVVGAADAATGNEQLNDTLGANRAKLIADILINDGVASERIATFSVGGISTYTPAEANRNAIVRLLLP